MPKVTITRQAVGEYTLPVPMGSPLDSFGDNSGGFWTVVAAQGSDRGNGDAFGTYYNPNPTLNSQYNQKGYDYAIDVPAGAGSTSVDLYDPTFCAVDPTKGTGDRWLDVVDLAVVLHLLHPLDRPGRRPRSTTATTSWSPRAGRCSSTSARWTRAPRYRDTSYSWPGASFFSLPDCTADTYHNRWWTLATVTTPGTYRLNVTTTDPTNINDQKGTSGSNKWGVRAISTDPTYKAHVYGMGRMAIYANVNSGHDALLPRPDRGGPCRQDDGHPALRPGRCDAATRPSRSSSRPRPGTRRRRSATRPTRMRRARSCGTNVTSLATTISGSAQYNNSWVTLTVSLPKTYTAPLPPGEPAGTLGGWWKIKYIFDNQTTDSTTWQVSIRGNPVHLVQP